MSADRVFRDIFGLLDSARIPHQARWAELDQAHLDRWIGELGVGAQWEQAVHRSGRA